MSGWLYKAYSGAGMMGSGKRRSLSSKCGPWSSNSGIRTRADEDASLYQRSRRKVELLALPQGGLCSSRTCKAASFFREVGATHLSIATIIEPLFGKTSEPLFSLLSAHLERHPFLPDSTVSLADFAFMGPFHAQFSRGPIPSIMIKTTAPLVWGLVERVTGLGKFCKQVFRLMGCREGALRGCLWYAK